MLIISFDELTLNDLVKYTFTVREEQIIPFCIDIQHRNLVLCTAKKEDHIVGGVGILSSEQDIENLDNKEIAKLLLNHVVGGSIYIDKYLPNKAFILLGGSSLEQNINSLIKKMHSKQTFTAAYSIAQTLFKKFYTNITIKIAS